MLNLAFLRHKFISVLISVHYALLNMFSLPAAAPDEILISKSPQYAGGEEKLRQKRAKRYRF